MPLRTSAFRRQGALISSRCVPPNAASRSRDRTDVHVERHGVAVQVALDGEPRQPAGLVAVLSLHGDLGPQPRAAAAPRLVAGLGHEPRPPRLASATVVAVPCGTPETYSSRPPSGRTSSSPRRRTHASTGCPALCRVKCKVRHRHGELRARARHVSAAGCVHDLRIGSAIGRPASCSARSTRSDGCVRAAGAPGSAGGGRWRPRSRPPAG